MSVLLMKGCLHALGATLALGSPAAPLQPSSSRR